LKKKIIHCNKKKSPMSSDYACCSRGAFYPSGIMPIEQPVYTEDFVESPDADYVSSSSETDYLTSTDTMSSSDLLSSTETMSSEPDFLSSTDTVFDTESAGTIVDIGTGTTVDITTGVMMNARSGLTKQVPVQLARAMAVQAAARDMWNQGYRPLSAYH
jgi:hypothetical protein